MKFKNEMIIICLIFFILISMSAVSAEYNNTNIITTDNNVDDNVLSIDNEEILKETDSGSFSDLSNKINNGTSNEITLENDYNYTAAYNGGNGVTITKSDIVIDGDGHIIDGNGQSRIFNINSADYNITLKNINFVNAYAAYAGAIYFKGGHIDIINCTFINNAVQQVKDSQGIGGAMYIRPSEYANIDHCTFINNTASRTGGAIASYGTFDFNLTNSIIINNGGYSDTLNVGTSSGYIDYNWWGSTEEDKDECPVYTPYLQPSNWYYLDMDIDPIDSIANIKFKLINSLNNYYALPLLRLNIKTVNATSVDEVSINNSGESEVGYTLTSENGLLTVSFNGIELSKNITSAGDFEKLNRLINDDLDNYIELDRDYTYTIGLDQITDGIAILRSDIVIDGKGLAIDAASQSRIFKITGDNVTLKNIRFLNGYSSYAGALYYSGQNISISNCTFENNNVQNTTTKNGLGGAMYINPSLGCIIENCTFISNSATVRGGAIFLFTQTGVTYNLNRNIFMGNNASAGGAIATNGQGTINISNSIFLNNTIYQVYSVSNYITLDYNWWGNTINNYTDWPNVAANVEYDWYFLNMEINETEKTATITLNNYYDGSVGPVSNYNLPEITLDVSGINVTVQNKVTLDNTGKATISYNPTSEQGSITLSIGDVSLTKNLNKLLGEFGKLDELIRTSNNGLIQLDKNYTYTNGLDDDFKNGITISKSNIVIDGKGLTIDAKGQSRIFYVTGNHVTLKNINFINGNSTYAGAVFGYGDYLDIINCTFLNNTATTSMGGAVYCYPDSYSRVVNSTFINNTAVYGGAIVTREYDTGVTSDVINCTFINNKAASKGGAILDYSENMNAVFNVCGCVFSNNAASEGNAIYTYFGHADISNSIFLDNPNKAVETYGSYTTADYNWWGNTYDNRTVSPSVHKNVKVSKWLYLDIIPNISDSTATVSINNVFDNETKTTSIYSTTCLPSINVKLAGENATLSKDNVTLDNIGKGVVSYVITNDSSITASYGGISQTRTIEYGSFSKLQALIRNARDDSVITLTRDYVWGMGDTITEGIIVYNKNNLTIDGGGHIIDASGKSRVFGVNIGSRNIVFKNIIIQNGKFGKDDINKDFGGAIVWESPDGQIINCTFKNNFANGTTGGGALYVSGDGITIKDCTFINNSHGFSVGGAIYVYGYDANIINSVFENNTADTIQGGAGAIFLQHKSDIINCTFINNAAKYGGAIIDNNYDDSNNLIDGCTFIGNKVTDENTDIGAGAIYSHKSTIKNSVFIANQAKYGAAITNQLNDSSVDSCLFVNNTGLDIIFWWNGGKIKNSIFINNDASSYTVISNLYGGVSVEDNWFGNTANNYENNYVVSNLADQTSWLFLNATDMDYDFNSSTLTMKFGLFAYDPNTGAISAYDSSKLPSFNLTLSGENVTFNKNEAGIDEPISGTAEYKGNIVAEYENVRYVIPFKFRQQSWIEVDPVFNITVSDKVNINALVRPWEDDYNAFLTVVYSSTNTSVVTVDNNGKITGVSEGVANITIFYNGLDYQGRDRCLPSNATVLVNVTRMATHFNFIYEPPTSVYVGEGGYFTVKVCDAKNRSVSGASVTYTNNDENTIRLSSNSYTALKEGIANITVSYAGSNEYLPVSYDIIFEISRRNATITAETDYLEMLVSKYYSVGVSIVPASLSIVASSNDTDVAISDNDGLVHAVGVGLAKITFRFEGNNNYKPTEIYLIVNVTDVKSHISAPDVMNVNPTDYLSIGASVRDSNDYLIGYDISYSSNDTSVVTVDEYGIINATGEGIANITLTFAGKGEYGPATRNVTVIVKKLQTEIIVNDTFSMLAGDTINLNATLNYPNAGKLQYSVVEGDNVIAYTNGNIKATSEGVAKVKISYVATSQKYTSTEKTVTISVDRKTSHINVIDSIMVYIDEDKVIPIETLPEGAALTFASSDESIVKVDSSGKITGVKLGKANVTISYAGSGEYLPNEVNITVEVVIIPTEIVVNRTYGLKIDETGNLNATLNHPEAGNLTYASDDESIVTVDEHGNLTTASAGSANITITFAGNEKYASATTTVLVTVYRSEITTEISVQNNPVEIYVGGQANIGAVLNPANAGSLIYASTNSTIVVVDNEGNIRGLKVGTANITVTFQANDRFNASNATVKVIVSQIPTEIIADNANITLNFTESTNIQASLNHIEAGNLTYISSDENVVSVDENGLVTAIGVGNATITISYGGNENYTAAEDVKINVTVVTVATEISVDSNEISLFVDGEANVNASLNYPDAGSLIYSSSNPGVVTVDENGNLVAVGEGEANITIKFEANGKYLASNRTVKVTVSKIATAIGVEKDSITLNLTDSEDIVATLSPAGAGDLTYSSSDESVVSVDENGRLTTVGEGNAVITINFAGNNKFNASEATVNVAVTTVATNISVSSGEVSLYVDDKANVNASLNYPDAGSLIYSSSNPGVVTVDENGELVAVSEGEANITIKFEANGKYLASNKTVKVTVSRISSVITVDKTVIELFVDDTANVNATLNHPGIEDVVYDSLNGTVAIIDENGNILAKNEGKTNITITFFEDNKYLACEREVTVIVSRIPTHIEANDTLIVETGYNQKIYAVLNPSAGSLNYSSSNSSIISVDGTGYIQVIDFGTVNITISFAGNYKYLPSSATTTVSVKGRETEIEVNNNITLTVEDTVNLNAGLIHSETNWGSSDLKYESSNPDIVSVDANGKVTALKKGKAQIRVYYEGIILENGAVVNYPSEAKVNVTVLSKASEISISTNKVTLTVDEDIAVTAVLVIPNGGEITFASDDESIATVDANGLIKAIGKGTATVTVSYAGNEDYRPSNKTIQVVVNPIQTEITVNDSFTILKGDFINLEAILNPDAGPISYRSNDEAIATVDNNGKVTGILQGTAVITVFFEGTSRYDDAVEYVTVHVTVNQTSITADKSMELNVGDVSKINAILNPDVGYLEFISSDENIAKVYSDGKVLAMAEGKATITVKFAGNPQYEPSNVTVDVTVTKNTQAVKLDAVSSEDSSNSVFSVNLPSDATGTLKVLVDGKVIETKPLKGGSATVNVKGLSSGDHKVTLIYSGDSKYGSVTKTTTIHVYDIRMDKNKNIIMLYTSGAKYTVHLTKDTQAMAGKTVVFTINGKKVTAVTNKMGYASVKINLPPRAKAYVVIAKFGDIKVANKVTVKSIINAKYIKAKKSAKKVRITVSLKKVNGKYLKYKKVKLKFNGKTYKAKTNKKGIAVFKIKQKAFKYLEVGKKYKYKVIYGKDRVTKKIKIKR